MTVLLLQISYAHTPQHIIIIYKLWYSTELKNEENKYKFIVLCHTIISWKAQEIQKLYIISDTKKSLAYKNSE